MNTNAALQVTNFDFYGDSLVAIRDNATGEIYTAINFVLRGIGFNREQIRKKRDKWLNDVVLSKSIENFKIPTSEGVTQKGTPSNSQDAHCISIRKLPLALAKIRLLEKYELMSNSNPVRQKTIFDDVVENIPVNHQKGPVINE